MKIINHLLEGDNIDFKESPNHRGEFGNNQPDTIIVHYTAGRSRESSVESLCNPRSQASAHVVIGRDGRITQLVPFNKVAWHAGKSSYNGRSGFNQYAIGIEIDNAGRLTKSGNGYLSWFGKQYGSDEVIEAVHRNETRPDYWHAYNEEQIDLVFEFCEVLIDTYNITTILGHEEVSPGRKSDPGPAFPLDKLRDRILLHDRADEGSTDITDSGTEGYVTASRLNIRKLPFASAETVAPPLIKGTEVDILGERDGWYEVDAKTRGWVSKDYIKVNL